MSYELYVHTPGSTVLSAELLAKNMMTLGWQMRLLNFDDVVIDDLEDVGAVMAWDFAYEPAPVFAERYVAGVPVDFMAIPDEEVNYLGGCGFAVSDIPLNELDMEDLRQGIRAEDDARFTALFDTETVRTFELHTGASSHLYRFLLQNDLAVLIAWMTNGLLYDPQEGVARFVDALPSMEISPLERAIKHAEEMEAIWADEARRETMIAEWLKQE